MFVVCISADGVFYGVSRTSLAGTGEPVTTALKLSPIRTLERSSSSPLTCLRLSYKLHRCLDLPDMIFLSPGCFGGREATLCLCVCFLALLCYLCYTGSDWIASNAVQLNIAHVPIEDLYPIRPET